MKTVVFIGKTGGSITPKAKAEYLKHHAHLLGIIGNVKYFDYEGKGFKVISAGEYVAQVEECDLEEAKKIISCSKLDFKGGF